jgi:hypothetical protein
MSQIVVHTAFQGEKVYTADGYSVEAVGDIAGFLDVHRNGAGVIATFKPDEWQWVEARDRPATNDQPLHPRRERTSSEKATVLPIHGA